jgi:hypothetical protein
MVLNRKQKNAGTKTSSKLVSKTEQQVSEIAVIRPGARDLPLSLILLVFLFLMATSPKVIATTILGPQ